MDDLNTLSNSDTVTQIAQSKVDELLTIQYDALVTSDYSELNSLLEENAITSLYCDSYKYRVDAAFEFNDYWLDYSYDWLYFNAKLDGDFIFFEGKFDLENTYVSEFEGGQKGVFISGKIKVTSDTLYFTDIDTTEGFYVDLKDTLSFHSLITLKNGVARSANESNSNIGYQSVKTVETNKTTSFLEDTLDALKAEMSSEHVDMTVLALEESDIATRVAYATSYSYSASKGVDYANKWYGSRNPDFVSLGADCTNFVSQCVWVAYGKKMESSSNLNNWFAHKNGCGSPWESVESLWDYSTSRSGSATGPRASGYNNNSVYTGIAAYALPAGNVVQFKRSGGSEYVHSVYVVSNNATNYNNYGSVGIVQHSGDYKSTIQSKISSYGSDAYMRRLSFSSAYF